MEKPGGNFRLFFKYNAWDARELHYQLSDYWENHLISDYNQMIDKGLYFPDRKITKTFRELMKETVVFPRWVFLRWIHRIWLSLRKSTIIPPKI